MSLPNFELPPAEDLPDPTYCFDKNFKPSNYDIEGYPLDKDNIPIRPKKPTIPNFFEIRKAIAHFVCRVLKVDHRKDVKQLGALDHLCWSYSYDCAMDRYKQQIRLVK